MKYLHHFPKLPKLDRHSEYSKARTKCRYYALTWRFYMSRLNHPPRNAARWESYALAAAIAHAKRDASFWARIRNALAPIQFSLPLEVPPTPDRPEQNQQIQA